MMATGYILGVGVLFTHVGGRHIEIDGAQIYVEVRGNPDGRPLVLLHGGFGNIGDFNGLAPYLAASFRLIGVDTRGHGKSTLGSAPLTYRRLQQDVETVVRHLGLGPFAVIGHSDGGIAALRMAAGAMAPERLVVVGTPWALAPDDPVRAIFTRITAESWRAKFPHTYEQYQALNPEPDFTRLADTLRSLWLDDSGDGYPGETVRIIRCPLLAVRGAEDKVVPHSQAAGLVQRVAGATLREIPSGDHSPHEHPGDDFISGVTAFLEK